MTIHQFSHAQTKNPPSRRRWIRVDALGDFRFVTALTKLSQSAQGTRFITGRIIQLLLNNSGNGRKRQPRTGFAFSTAL